MLSLQKMIRFIIYYLINGTLLHGLSSGNNINENNPVNYKKSFIEHKSFLNDDDPDQNKDISPQKSKNDTMQKGIEEGDHLINDVAGGSVSFMKGDEEEEEKGDENEDPLANESTEFFEDDPPAGSAGRNETPESKDINAASRGDNLPPSEKDHPEIFEEQLKQQKEATEETLENMTPDGIDQMIEYNKKHEAIKDGEPPETVADLVKDANEEENVDKNPDEPLDRMKTLGYDRKLTTAERIALENNMGDYYNNHDLPQVERLRITSQMCHSIANTLHFDAFRQAQNYESVAQELIDLYMKQFNLYQRRVGRKHDKEKSQILDNIDKNKLWQRIKLRAKEYVFGIWNQFLKYEELPAYKKDSKNMNMVKRWYDQKYGVSGNAKLSFFSISKEDFSTAWPELEGLKTVDPEMVGRSWGTEKVHWDDRTNMFGEHLKQRNPTTIEQNKKKTQEGDPNTGGSDNTSQEGNPNTGGSDNTSQEGEPNTGGSGTTSQEGLLQTDEKPVVSLLKIDTRNTKKNGLGALIGAVNGAATGAGAGAAAADELEIKWVEHNIQKLLLRFSENLKKGHWPPPSTPNEAVFKLGQYAYHGLNPDYKYNLMHVFVGPDEFPNELMMPKSKLYYKLVMKAVHWLKDGLQEEYETTLKRLKDDKELNKLRKEEIHYENKHKRIGSINGNEEDRLHILLKMGILGDIDRKSEGEPIWITEVCDRQLAAYLMYSELYTTSKTGDFAYMAEKDATDFFGGKVSEEEKQTCKVAMNPVPVHDDFPA